MIVSRIPIIASVRRQWCSSLNRRVVAIVDCGCIAFRRGAALPVELRGVCSVDVCAAAAVDSSVWPVSQRGRLYC